MTNEEAYKIISEFCFTGFEDNKKPSFKLFGAIHELILDVGENAKLKGELKAEREWRTKTREELLDRNKEIESVKEDLKNEREWISGFRKRETKLTEENTKLKAEIEQLKSYAIELINFRNISEETATSIQQKMQREQMMQAEIEQLKWKLSSTETQRDLKGYDAKRNADIMSSQLKIIKDLKGEIEQLKSELEQSVKLPCKVGDVVYSYSTYFGILTYEINSIYICCGISFEAIASRNDDMLDSIDFDIEDIGKTVFLKREEAEQSLRRINEKL